MRPRFLMSLVAAALLAVAGQAHALKFVDDATTDPASPTGDQYAVATVTYAKETLLKGTANVTKDVYHNITRDHLVSAPAEIAAAATDQYIVSYTLDGMVFSGPPTIVPSALTIASGGAAGDNSVVFRKDALTPLTTTGLIVLTATFSVSEGGGTISRTVINQSLEGLPGVNGTSDTHTATVAVKPALNEMVKPMEPAPQAKADAEFMNFGGTAGSPMLRASLGTIEIGVATPNLRDARAANDDATFDPASPGTAGADVGMLVQIAPAAATGEDMANPVTFSGNFGFVETLALAVNCDAGTSLTELRKADEDDPKVLTSETIPHDATMFPIAAAEDDGTTADVDESMPSMRYLCIEVDGETAIPATAPYMVTTKYKGLASAAFPPVGATSALAMITRDGTAVHIPYLTTYEGYNHRITITNRGSRDTTYTMSFKPEANVTATPGSAASGTVAAGETMVISATDAVTLEGGSRTHATITMPMSPNLLDVSTTLVNRETRTAVVTVHLSDNGL